MILLDEFKFEVCKHFEYLISEFGFSYVGTSSQPFSYYVQYRKRNRIVSVDLGYRHNFIEINIFNKVDEFFPSTQNFDNSVSLSSLMYKKKPSIEFKNEYGNMMPNVLGLQKSLDVLSKLFKIYAQDILDFKKWVSLNDCK